MNIHEKSVPRLAFVISLNYGVYFSFRHTVEGFKMNFRDPFSFYPEGMVLFLFFVCLFLIVCLHRLFCLVKECQ